MSLVSRLASTTTRALVTRVPCTGKSIGLLAWRGIKTKGGPEKSGGGHDEPSASDIHAQNPHLGYGSGDVFVGPGVGKPPPAPKSVEDFKNPGGQWISYGFDMIDKHNDRFYANVYAFYTVTLLCFGYGFLIYYMPDIRLTSWSHREAYLELERRSKLPGPLISRDLIPAEKIVLPSEEELGDTQIII